MSTCGLKPAMRAISAHLLIQVSSSYDENSPIPNLLNFCSSTWQKQVIFDSFSHMARRVLNMCTCGLKPVMRAISAHLLVQDSSSYDKNSPIPNLPRVFELLHRTFEHREFKTAGNGRYRCSIVTNQEPLQLICIACDQVFHNALLIS
jgi:hypothetical protein